MRVKRFTSSAGLEILAGQDDVSNEAVTFRLGQPGDYWFHVHGFSGSHVVLRAPADGDADRDSIREAAAIAAWYSRMRAGGNVGVTMCRVRDVRKPGGVKTGTVRIRNTRTITVRPALPDAVDD